MKHVLVVRRAWVRSLIAIVLGCGGGGGAAPDATPNADSSTDSRADGDTTCADPGAAFSVKAQEIIGTGLTQPVYVSQAPGNDSDLFVVEKGGTVQIVRNGTLLSTPFLDVSSDVNIPAQDAEGGLLGLAFNPDYATTGRFFIYLSVKADPPAGADPKPERVAIREYHHTAGADSADPALVNELLFFPHGAFNSLGGTIKFGPDHFLWLATGDAAQEPSPAQDLMSGLGKILRVDVDNPSVGPPGGIGGTAELHVWDYGLRNPYRFSFDRPTGRLYLADAGDNLFEEVNIEEMGVGHHDFGWDRMEGMHCHDGSSSCGDPGTLPQYELAHGASFSVIIGGAVYRGSAIPNMRCRYLFAVFGAGRIMSFVYDGATVGHVVELSDMFSDANVLSVTSIVEDNAGELYMTTIDGKLYKIIAG